LEYITNTMKYTINTPKYIEKDSNTLVTFKIHLFIIKNTLLCFNIHTYTFQIHNSTFQKLYMLLTYITIPLLYTNILPYTSIYVETVMRPLYSAPFCLVTNTIFQKCHGASLFYQDVDGLPWHICSNPKIKHIPQIPYILLVNQIFKYKINIKGLY
jgi:hypothetical protein